LNNSARYSADAPNISSRKSVFPQFLPLNASQPSQKRSTSKNAEKFLEPFLATDFVYILYFSNLENPVNTLLKLD
jgi:hypothetical protein